MISNNWSCDLLFFSISIPFSFSFSFSVCNNYIILEVPHCVASKEIIFSQHSNKCDKRLIICKLDLHGLDIKTVCICRSQAYVYYTLSLLRVTFQICYRNSFSVHYSCVLGSLRMLCTLDISINFRKLRIYPFSQEKG